MNTDYVMFYKRNFLSPYFKQILLNFIQVFF